MQSRRDHARIVEHQNIAGLQKIQQVGKLVVLDASGFPLQNQQARAVAARRGLLRDELGRQVEMKISGAHAASVTERGRSDNSHFAAIVNNF